MTYTVGFTHFSKNDLSDISLYIAKDSKDRAKRFVQDLQDTLEKNLRDFPYGAPTFKGVYRVFHHKGYSALYVIDEKEKRVTIKAIKRDSMSLNRVYRQLIQKKQRTSKKDELDKVTKRNNFQEKQL